MSKPYLKKDTIDNCICYNGDCLKVMKLIPDKSIDMILCDLPYGSTACKWDIIIPFEPLWEQYKRIIKDKGAIVLFGQEPFSSNLRLSNIKQYKYDWIWIKEHGTLFQVAKYQPMILNELISIFGKKINYYPIIEKLNKPRKEKFASSLSKSSPLSYINKGYRFAEFRYPKNVLNFKRDKNKIHPTQKPVALLWYLIKTYTLEGETVLDNCAGSGSTGVACKYTNRKAILIEWSPVKPHDIYYNLMIERLKNPEKKNIGNKISNSLFE